MKRIGLSARDARELLRMLREGAGSAEIEASRPVAIIERGLASHQKHTLVARARAATTRAAKSKHATTTAGLRDVASIRSGGRCEWCGDSRPLEMDHFFGRVRALQSISNCWMLCPNCHHDKTNSRPDAATWCRRFGKHCTRHGYSADAKSAHVKAAYFATKHAFRTVP